jgi:hypothetical protein
MLLAYLDPGTGSLVFQIACAGILGAAFSVKSCWRGLLGLFSNKSTVDD